MAAQLAPSGHKAKLAVFGYTPVMANLTHPNRAALAKAVKRTWHINDFRTAFELKEHFPIPGWKAVFPVALQALQNDPGQVRMPRVRGADEGELAAAGARFAKTPDNPYFKDYAGAEGCDAGRAAADLRATVDSLLTIADKVVVFVPPATPIVAEAYPCLDAAARSAAAAAASPDVAVVADDWRSYGLRYSDFLYQTAEPGVSVIDPIHTNLTGALKVTARLAKILRPAYAQAR
jgi:hypothetical protein